MSSGLRPHYHQFYLYDTKRYYNDKKHCMVNKATFRCMICGKTYHERYEYKPPPRHVKKVLERQKKKYGNRW